MDHLLTSMYAVLQTSLDQPITRESLEAAVMSTQTLAKPDCARLQRELFGFVAEKLSQEDAFGLQAGLRTQGIETDVICEAVLPTLPAPHHPQSFAFSGDGLIVTDLTGQGTPHPIATLVFAAGGHVNHSLPPGRNMELVLRPGIMADLEMVTEKQAKEVLEFRIEFYVTRAPFRFQCVLDEKTAIRANDQVLRLRDRELLDNLLLQFTDVLPPVQTNLGIKKAAAGEDFLYPSVHAFEEEIIWSLYRLANGGPP